jgi:hypothetical protein
MCPANDFFKVQVAPAKAPIPELSHPGPAQGPLTNMAAHKVILLGSVDEAPAPSINGALPESKKGIFGQSTNLPTNNRLAEITRTIYSVPAGEKVRIFGTLKEKTHSGANKPTVCGGMPGQHPRGR